MFKTTLKAAAIAIASTAMTGVAFADDGPIRWINKYPGLLGAQVVNPDAGGCYVRIVNNGSGSSKKWFQAPNGGTIQDRATGKKVQIKPIPESRGDLLFKLHNHKSCTTTVRIDISGTFCRHNSKRLSQLGDLECSRARFGTSLKK